MITGTMIKVLDMFHHWTTRRITGKMDQLFWGGRLGTTPERRGYRGDGDLDNTVICTKVAGKNCGIYCDTPNLRIV